MQTHIVSYSEKSDGPQCNRDHVRLVESSVTPTLESLRRKHIVNYGYCTNVSYPGCENCPGSTIEDFEVEPFTPERAKELGLKSKLN
jgi:hypothetical protein